VRNAEGLTNVRKHLILLEFVSYEAVRLWWWGGNCGVVSFGKTPFFCSIPTLASNAILGGGGAETARLGQVGAVARTKRLLPDKIAEGNFAVETP
jgi:hypothetical protein